MEANPILLQKKYARVIERFSAKANISSREALDFFYRSLTYQDISEGISDMHCRRRLFSTGANGRVPAHSRKKQPPNG